MSIEETVRKSAEEILTNQQRLADTIEDVSKNQQGLTELCARLFKRVERLETQRDVQANRIIDLENKLNSLTEKFDAHIEMYHSAYTGE